MTKKSNIRNRVLLFVVLLTFPIICRISFGILSGFYDNFQLGVVFWGKYIVLLVMVLYAIAGQYLIKKIVQEKWKVGIVLTLILLIFYTCSIALWPINIPGLTFIISLISRPECNFVPAFLLVYTIIYLVYDKKKIN